MENSIELTVEQKINEVESRIIKSGSHYWAKISTFQLEYDGKSWKIVRTYDAGKAYEKCQLCGHYPCRYMFVIGSPQTGETLTIGDECVINYCTDVNAKEILKKYRTKVTKYVANLKTNKDMIVRIKKWTQDNHSNYFLSSIIRQLYSGRRLSKKQVETVEKILSEPAKETNIENIKKASVCLQDITQSTNDLSEWERGFVNSITDKLKRKIPLSEKQMNCLVRIATEIDKVDEETIEKLVFLLEGKHNQKFPYFISDIFRDMHGRKQRTFSEKQKNLVNKWYKRATMKDTTEPNLAIKTLGVFELPTGEIYVVKPNRMKTRLYAKKLVETPSDRLTETNKHVKFDFVYEKGAIYKIREEHRMNVKRAKELMIRYSRCIVCGKRLKVAESVERGIGPVCIKYFRPTNTY